MRPSAAAVDPERLPVEAEAVARDDGEPTIDWAPWQPSVAQRVAEAWRSRHLLRPLAARAVPTYRGRVLGRAWLVLRPAMEIFGFAVIFAGVLGAPAPRDVPYLVFMVLNIQAFRFFELTVLYETLSTRMVKHMTRGLRMPLLLIPLSAVARSLVSLGVYWGIAAILLAYYVVVDGRLYLDVSPRLLLGVAGLALCALYGLALGLITSVLYPRVMDIRYVVAYGTQIWLFLTPVFYPLDALPESLRGIAQVNPLTPVISLLQYAFFGSGDVHAYGLAWSVTAIAITGVFGLWFFNRHATQWIGIYARADEGDDADDEAVL